MNQAWHIRLKALALLIVFGMHTVVAFACSLDCGPACGSHSHEGAPAGNHPQPAAEKIGKEHHGHGHADSPQRLSPNHPDAALAAEPCQEDGNCCTPGAAALFQTDKVVTAAAESGHPVSASLSLYISTEASFPLSSCKADQKYFVRLYHPPIADLRIWIQSFQI